MLVLRPCLASNKLGLHTRGRHLQKIVLFIKYQHVVIVRFLFSVKASVLLFAGNLMRFVVTANLLGFPAISVPVSNLTILVFYLLQAIRRSFYTAKNSFQMRHSQICIVLNASSLKEDQKNVQCQ